jgi:prophage regulatory protein
MPGPDVAGPGEVLTLLGGISRERLRQLRQRPDFPAPRELEIGMVWDRGEILAWQRARMDPRRRAFPTALAHYRKHKSVRGAARATGIPENTLRDWLREHDLRQQAKT